MIRSFMEVDPIVFQSEKEKAHAHYVKEREIYCPYFGQKVVLNSEGFHHLQFSAGRERPKQEQLTKFRLLSSALQVIRKSGTLQEYRVLLEPVGKKKQDGSTPMKEVQYCAFIAIVGEKQKKIRVIVRKIGNGNIAFHSVMYHSKRKNGKQRLYTTGIENGD